MMTENSLKRTSHELKLNDLKNQREALDEQIDKLEGEFVWERRKRMFELFNSMLISELPCVSDLSLLMSYIDDVISYLKSDTDMSVVDAIEEAMKELLA